MVKLWQNNFILIYPTTSTRMASINLAQNSHTRNHPPLVQIPPIHPIQLSNNPTIYTTTTMILIDPFHRTTPMPKFTNLFVLGAFVGRPLRHAVASSTNSITKQAFVILGSLHFIIKSFISSVPMPRKEMFTATSFIASFRCFTTLVALLSTTL